MIDTSAYDNADNLTSIAAAQGSTSIDNFAYTVDTKNQVASVSSTGVPSDNHTYTYTPLEQLAATNTSSNFSYDHADNPTSLAGLTPSNPAVQAFDPANQLTTSSQITLVGTNHATGSNSNTSTVNLPSGTTTNDQILVAITINNGVAITTPSGYTLVGNYNTGSGSSHAQTALYRKTAASGDTSVTVAVSAKTTYSITLAVYRGVNTTTPIDTTSHGTTVSGASVTAPGLTPAHPGEQLAYIAGELTTATATLSLPSTFATETTATTTTTAEAVADQPLVTVGAIGSETATSNKTGDLVGFLVALNPAQTTYGYDNRGNRTTITSPSGTVTTLGYDQASRLTSYGPNTTYTYNGDGLRMTKTTSGTTENYTYDQTDKILADGSTDFIYGPNNLPLEQISGTAVTWYHHDRLGSTRVLTNSSGAAVASFTYSPYGALTASTGTATTPLGFAGAYRDPESGYLYLIHRYLDSVTGQFLTRDPLDGITQSPYGYAADDPLNNVDSSGLSWYNPFSWSSGTWRDIGEGFAVAALIVGTAALVATTGGVGLTLVGGAVESLGDGVAAAGVGIAETGETAGGFIGGAQAIAGQAVSSVGSSISAVGESISATGAAWTSVANTMGLAATGLGAVATGINCSNEGLSASCIAGIATTTVGFGSWYYGAFGNGEGFAGIGNGFIGASAGYAGAAPWDNLQSCR